MGQPATTLPDVMTSQEVPHSTRGASSAERWMNCTASPQLIAKLPDADQKKAGFAADEGTAAHEIAAKCLENGQEPWEFIGTEVVVGSRSFVVNDEMAEAVQVHVNFVFDLMQRYADHDPVLHVEKALHSDYSEYAFGTSDVAIDVQKLRLLVVVDYKHGIGVTAEPWKPQTKMYGAMALERFGGADLYDDVQTWIVQPRHPHPQGLVRRHDMKAAALWEWFTDHLLVKMAETESPYATLEVGEWCHFCPARGHCPALTQATNDLDPSLDPVYFTDDELGSYLQRSGQIKKFLDALEQEAFARAKSGRKVTGQKLVRKQSSRIWKGEAETALREALGEKVYDKPKLLSPPQVEKLPGGKALVTKYAYKPDSGLTLASEGDKRPEVKLTAEEIFGVSPTDVDF